MAIELVAKPDFNVGDIVDKCLIFGEALSGKQLFPYQRILAKSIFKEFLTKSGNDIVGLVSRQSGKTEVISFTIAVMMVLVPFLAQMYEYLKEYRNGVRIGAFAPINDQIDTLTYRIRDLLYSRASQEILKDAEINIKIISGQGDITLSNGSFYTARSTAPNTRLESKTYDIIFTDESQSIDTNKYLLSIRPMGSFTNACFVHTGTPYPHKSEFYRICTEVKKSNPSCYHEFDYKFCSKSNPHYKKFCDKEFEKKGFDSDYVRMMFRLQWIFERGVYITEELLESCMDKGIEVKRRSRGAENSSRIKVVAGLDLGKKFDSTVLTIGEYDYGKLDEFGNCRKTIYNWLELLGDDYESQYDQIISFLREYSDISMMIVDATGLGDVVCDSLQRRFDEMGWDIEIVRVNFTAEKPNLANSVYEHLSRKNLVIPAHSNTRKIKAFKRFYEQCTNLIKEYSSNGKLMVSHSDDKDAHDDYFYSMALFTYGQESELEEVEVMQNYHIGRYR